MHNILFSIWFFLPAGLANASPVFATRIKYLSPLIKPIDFGHSLRGRRLLGDNKTWLGIIFAVFVGLIVILFQILMYNNIGWIRTISGQVNYSHLSIIWLGPLMGFGALFGDAVESFFKRQFGVKPGQSWFPFDQIDYILGGILLSLPIVNLGIYSYLLIIIVWLLIHLISSYIAYLFGLKKKPI